MLANTSPDEPVNEDYVYEEMYSTQPQGNTPGGVNEIYVAMGTVPEQEYADNLYENDPPIYQNIIQKSRKAVFGEGIYLATGHPAEGNWNPSYQKGISFYPPDTKITLKEFLKNQEEYLSHFDKTLADEDYSERVQFLLHKVFPYLESKLAKTGITLDILNILVRLSCCRKCSLVTRHALHMILDILLTTRYDSSGIFNNFIIKCESDLRDSILGEAQEETAVFDHEIADDQGLRVLVYSRVLMIFYVNIVQGLIPPVALGRKDKYEDVVQKLIQVQEQNVFNEKEWPRYAIRCIKEIQERVKQTPQKKKNDAWNNFLIWLQEHNRTGEVNKGKRNKSVGDFLSKIKASKKTWFDFHMVVFSLGSQIKERPGNIEILRTLLEMYSKSHSDFARKWSSEGEWQTGLVLGSVLEGIVNHNQDRNTRTEACLCLVHYYTSLTKRNSGEKLWAHESLHRCLYGQVENCRRIILNNLQIKGGDGTPTQGERELLPITRSMDHLLQIYKKQLSKRPLKFIGKFNKKGCYSASFRGENAMIKILESSKDDILEKEKMAPTRNQRQLVIEAYTLRRLNSKPHPNILRVFAYDTSAQPYHLITEEVAKGSLLKFLQNSRSRLGHMPSPSELIKMILGVMDAVIYLNDQHLVHLAIMATNILVAQDNVCKLTGFQFTREMTKQGNGKYEYVCVLDEMATRHAAPECFKSGKFSEKSMSWAIGVMLFEMHTYGVSPYNQYRNHEADQIRTHVISGGKLKMEDCIRKEVCDLIEKKCIQHEREKRIDLMRLKTELKMIYKQFKREDNDCPPASYPSLTIVDLAQSNDTMSTSSALEERDKEKNIGFFGSPTRSHDIAIIRHVNGVQVIRELVEKTKQADLDMLKNLKHRNMVFIHSLSNHDERYMALVTEDSGRGNLLKIILDKQCRRETLVTFIAQIAQAMEYMHDNGMIHSDLRAEHIMIFSDKVKLARLGRSKSVGKMVDTKCKIPEDAVRWSPPEVIKDGIYSHSSDVYSFGIMCFELFSALSAAEGSKAEDVKPFTTIKDDQVLAYLEGNNRPSRPVKMPKWFYIAVKQCLLHKATERPPFVLIVDALTLSKPFDSCLLSFWIKKHPDEAKYINTNKTQPQGASHVIPMEEHKSFEELCKSAPVEVFMKHTYAYKPGNKDSVEDQDNEPVLQDQEELYDEIYDFHKTFKSKVPEDTLYEQIANLENPCQRRPLPLPNPIQEIGNPTLVRGNSELALYASTSIINLKTSSPLSLHDHETSDPFYNNINDGSTLSPDDREWTSLPGPPMEDGKNNNKDSSPSSSSNGESTHFTQTSSYPMPASRANANLQIQRQEDRGAVGGEPAQGSSYPREEFGNDEEENKSLNAGPTECSWYSFTPLYEQEQNNGSGLRDLLEDNIRPALRRPAPLPRSKRPKHGS